MSIRPRSLSLGSFLLCACFSPGGQLTDASSDPNTGTGPGASTSTSTSTDPTTTDPSTTDPTTTVNNTASASSIATSGECGACEPPTPYCAPSGECIGCAKLPDFDMSCGAIDNTKPHCDQVGDVGTGQCVECVSTLDCNGWQCDLDTHDCVECVLDTDCPAELKQFCDGGTCSSCRAHDDCQSGACELDVGQCFPSKGTSDWYVDASAKECLRGNCTDLAPCCGIDTAFASAIKTGGKYHIVHVAPGTYTKQLLLTTPDRQVAVLGQPGVKIDVTGAIGSLIGLESIETIDSKLFLSRLEITGEGSTGVGCASGAFLGLDEVRLTGFDGDALFVFNCLLWARRSQFLNNKGGLWLSAGKARLENTIIAGLAMTKPALNVELVSELDILYSTIARQGDLADGLLRCADQDMMSPSTLTIRNSAMLSSPLNGPVNCTGTIINTSYSAVTDVVLAVGGLGNANINPDQAGAPFVDWQASDLHLLGDGNYLPGIARWEAGDPATDIDGLPRVTEDGMMDVAGADLPGRP